MSESKKKKTEIEKLKEEKKDVEEDGLTASSSKEPSSKTSLPVSNIAAIRNSTT